MQEGEPATVTMWDSHMWSDLQGVSEGGGTGICFTTDIGTDTAHSTPMAKASGMAQFPGQSL